MKKNELVELVRSNILKSEAVADNTKVLHYKKVEAMVAAAFAELMKLLAKKDPGEIESSYMKEYYGQVLSNASGMQYIPLPVAIVPLPNGGGVWYVKAQGSGVNYTASNQIMTSAFRSIPVSSYINDTLFRIGNDPSGKKAIIFQHIGDSDKRSVRVVDFGLIRDFSGYNDNEDIHLPDESFSFLMEKVLMWAGQRYNDKTNNNQ